MITSRDTEFLFEVGCLRHLPRVWQQFGGPNVANVAEHTLRVVWIAQILAQREGADIGRATQMALVHDLGKSRAGDAHWLNRAYIKRDQAGAVAATVEATSIEQESRQLYEEFSAGQTATAKIVKDADNLDVDLEFREQRQNWGFAAAEDDVRRNVYETQLGTVSAKQLWQEIYAANPQTWYVKVYDELKGSGNVGAAQTK